MVIKHLLWQMKYAKPQAFEICEIKKKGGGGRSLIIVEPLFRNVNRISLLSFYVFYSQVYNGPNALNNLRALG